MAWRQDAANRKFGFCQHSQSHGTRRSKGRAALKVVLGLSLGLAATLAAVPGSFSVQAQTQAPASDEVQSIQKRLGGLRGLPDDERATVTRQLALDIRKVSDPEARVNLASGLANLATEGDFGRDTLQEVTTTLAEALKAHPVAGKSIEPAYPYVTLAQLARYEKMQVSLNDPQYTVALSKLAEDDRRRQEADFTLTDLQGKSWNLKSLRGKVVLVNFWATWCPPCRKELPDLQALHDRFKDRGLVVLGISDETSDKVQPFVSKNKMTYPVLLDPGRKVNKLFGVEGIPRSLFYDRNGKLAAQAIDMRTKKQLLDLLGQAGLR